MTDDTGTKGLSAAIEAAWGIRDRPGKGPRPGLSLGQIVDAAIDVAVSEGLGAVSMSRVGSALGVSTMALYRYVSAKDELLTLMVDAAYGPPPRARAADEGWRDALSRWAWAMLVVARRHPWAATAPLTGLPKLPNEVGWMERALDAMRDTGLTEGERMSVLLLVAGYVRNHVGTMTQVGAAFAAAGSPDDAMRGHADLLRVVAGADRFPALNAVLASGVIDRADAEDDEFTFGLQRILDGIDVLVRTRT